MPRGRKSAKEALRRRGRVPLVRGKRGFTETYSLFAPFVLFADNVYIPRRMMRIRRIYLPYPLFASFAPFADTKYLSGKGVLLMAVTYDCRLSSSKVND